MNLLTLKTFDNTFEANMLKSKLESEDIQCVLFDENLVSLNPLYNITIGGIKLNINSADLGKAQSVLAEIDVTPITNDNDEIIACPKCKSTEIELGSKSLKGLKGIFSGLLAVFFMIYPPYVKHVYKCKQCGVEFNI